MSPFQAMVLRVARSVTASMSPSERKKMVMDLFKRFKGMGDGAVKGGKHEIFLAAEGYETRVLEDADDAELTRLHDKYIKGKKASAPTTRVADDNIVWMRKAQENLNRASGRLIDAEGYLGGSLDLLVEALKFAKAANADISDEDTEDLEKSLVSLIRRVDSETKALIREIREVRFKSKEAQDQYLEEVWTLQHPNQ